MYDYECTYTEDVSTCGMVYPHSCVSLNARWLSVVGAMLEIR